MHYRPGQPFDHDIPAAATARPVVIWEVHGTSGPAVIELKSDAQIPDGR
jgi:hypothetical protein